MSREHARPQPPAAPAGSRRYPVRRRGGQRSQPRCPGAGRGHRSPATEPSGPGAKLGPPDHIQPSPAPHWTQLGRTAANIAASGPSGRAAGRPGEPRLEPLGMPRSRLVTGNPLPPLPARTPLELCLTAPHWSSEEPVVDPACCMLHLVDH
jgi:hypothetical protein